MNDNWSRTDVIAFLTESLSTRLEGVPEGLENLHLVNDVGMDSLDVVALLYDLEDEFGVHVPDEAVAGGELMNINSLIEYVIGERA